MTPNEILEDAKTVAVFGARSGKLDDDELFDAIRAATSVASLDWSTVELVNLQRALGNSAAKIAPFTIENIPSKNPAARLYGQFAKGVLLVCGIFLLVICARFTIWQAQTSAVISEMEKNKAEMQTQEIYSLIPTLSLINDEKGFTDYSNASSAARTDLRNRLSEIRGIQQDIVADRNNFISLVGNKPDLYNIINTPFEKLSEMSLWWLGGSESTAEAKPLPGKSTTNPAGDPKIAEAGLKNSQARPTVPGNPGIDKQGVFSVDEEHTVNCLLNLSKPPVYRNVATATYKFSLISRDESKLVKTLRCLTEIDDQNAPQLYSLQQTKDYLTALSDWLLPALYGLLGAVIFQLREYLNFGRPDAPFFKVVLRMSLGAFAGIAIGWFWTGDGMGTLTLSALTIAFLVGYSIDVFMALLDRIVRIMEGWVGNLGGA